jgi:hypothetical protein
LQDLSWLIISSEVVGTGVWHWCLGSGLFVVVGAWFFCFFFYFFCIARGLPRCLALALAFGIVLCVFDAFTGIGCSFCFCAGV